MTDRGQLGLGTIGDIAIYNLEPKKMGWVYDRKSFLITNLYYKG